MFVQVDFFKTSSLPDIRKILKGAETLDAVPFFTLNYPSLPIPRTMVAWKDKFYVIDEVVVAQGGIPGRASTVVAFIRENNSIFRDG